MLRIKRDGVTLVEVADTFDAVRWLHAHTASSYDYALRYEGYTVEAEDGTPALVSYSLARRGGRE